MANPDQVRSGLAETYNVTQCSLPLDRLPVEDSTLMFSPLQSKIGVYIYIYIYIGLAHTSQQNCAFFRVTSQLVLYRKIMDVYCNNYTVDKMQYLVLNLVVPYIW